MRTSPRSWPGPLAGRPWVVGGLRVAERQRRWHLTLDRLTSGLSTGSVCVSEGVRRFSVEVGRLDPDRLVVIPNGVDPARFDRAEAADRASIGVPPDAFLTLYVGRLDPQKGLGRPARSGGEGRRGPPRLAPRPGRRRPRARGLAVEARRPIPRSPSESTGSADATTCPGCSRPPTCWSCPRSGRGCRTSSWRRWPPGSPVVGTAVEGTEDLVVPGQTGWLVPPGDAGALADALLEAAADPSRLRRFGEAARARVEASSRPRGWSRPTSGSGRACSGSTSAP